MLREILYILLVFIQLVLCLCIFYYTFRLLFIMYTMIFCSKPWRTPYVPTKRSVIRRAFKLLKIRDGDEVVDLGSGDGRFLFYGVKRVDANFTGIEINRMLVFLSRLRSVFVPMLGDLKIIRGNFLNMPLGRYNKIFMFSLSSQIGFILPKLEKELRTGALVVSVMFPIEARFLRLKKSEGSRLYKIFLYEKVD